MFSSLNIVDQVGPAPAAVVGISRVQAQHDNDKLKSQDIKTKAIEGFVPASGNIKAPPPPPKVPTTKKRPEIPVKIKLGDFSYKKNKA